MITELTDLVNNFPGAANQTWCFMHILNLIVKSILCQFDLLNTKNGKSLDDGSKKLLSLAGNVEDEEDIESRDGKGGVVSDEPEDDNLEGWIDECTLMDDDNLDKLEENVKPVRAL